ncbi:MAG: hypothetical protein ACTSPO_15160 [Candidatus Heimdallarchaeaceae archaeon]
MIQEISKEEYERLMTFEIQENECVTCGRECHYLTCLDIDVPEELTCEQCKEEWSEQEG